MSCPHLRYKFLFVCMSEGTPYVPELSHVREFCRSPRHEGYPFCTGKLKKLKPAGQTAASPPG
jgi:hypothetical protein